MRKIFFCFLLFLFLVPAVSALEPTCFTEYTSIVADGSTNISISTNARDDLFFAQDGNLIPSHKKSLITRDQFPYTLVSSIATFPLSRIDALMDDLPTTHIEVDPFMAPNGFSLTLDFGKILEKNTYIPVMDMTSGNTYSEMEISRDGKTYIGITGYDMESQSFRYLRITFPKGELTQKSSFLRTLRFDRNIADIYLLGLPHYGHIDAYRGWICDPYRLDALVSERISLGANIVVSQESKNIIPLVFVSLPTTGHDSDGDSIIDLRDNCPQIANLNQSDRNHDGRGDACTDDDGDGISGASDNCPTVPNPDQKDLNANQIGDACEFDSDTDGIIDALDNAIHISNPDQKDTDGDAIGDIMDNCSLYNPDQLDLDKNGKGDACDRDIEYRKTNDTDKDGVLDFADNCSKVSNLDQVDTDRDSVGDLCDNCATIQNTDQADADKNGKGNMCDDTDRDGVEGWRDNCPMISNPDQKDDNNNSVGNACEDTDRDSLSDLSDNCPTISNPDQKDTDGDKIGNACDTKDDRMLESNKTVFIVLFATIALVFIGGIVFFLRRFKF